MIQIYKWINLQFFLAVIIVNGLANMMKWGGNTTGSVSDKYANLFTPAPMTFAIWGLIYLLLAVFIVFQFGFGSFAPNGSEMCYEIGPWFSLSCIFNIAWIIAWHNDKILLSVIFIIGLLVSLILIMNGIGRLESTSAIGHISIWGFQIYLGWIVAATIANISAWLVSVGWGRFGLSSQFWTMVVLFAGAVIAVLFIMTKHYYFATFAIIWAYIGIIVKHISKNGYDQQYPMIVVFTFACIAIILVAFAIDILPVGIKDTKTGPKLHA